MRRVKRSDVAARAGVSETIVSYVINGNRYVDKEKKERVLKAVEELGYHPNPVARSLKGKESRHYLFIADDLVSEYFGSIIKEMEKYAADGGLLISLCSDNGDPGFVERVCAWEFDGIVVASATISLGDIQRLIDTSMPVVVLSVNEYPVFKGSYGLIYTGIKEGAKQLAGIFREQGKRRIAYVASKFSGPVNESDFRYQGYLEAIGDQERVVIDDIADNDALAEKLVRIHRETGFDALICRTDTIAAECMRILAGMGLKVPSDVAVAGFNNSRFTEYLTPTLTSVGMDKAAIASSAMDVFRKLREGWSGGAYEVRLETRIYRRGSA